MGGIRLHNDGHKERTRVGGRKERLRVQKSLVDVDGKGRAVSKAERHN
jgi:hypothetical protein